MSRSLITAFITSLIIGISAIISINYIIDPYGIYQFISIKGINSYKPSRFANTPDAKMINLLSIRPETILLGTSRTESGIDPDRVDWPADYKPVYNMALGLANFEEMEYILDQLYKVKQPKNIIIGLDFITFANTSSRQNLKRNDYSQNIKETELSILSWGMLKASVDTLLAQNDELHSNYSHNGFRTGRKYDLVLKKHSHYELFSRMNARYDYASILSHGLKDPIVMNNYLKLRKLIINISNRGSRVVLFFSPVHLQLLKKIYQQNSWSSFQSIKRRLVQDLSTELASGSVTLWDFALINDITSEHVPQITGQIMQYYYDSAHYKPELGDLLMRIILGQQQTTDYGVVLKPDTLEQHLTSLNLKASVLLP